MDALFLLSALSTHSSFQKCIARLLQWPQTPTWDEILDVLKEHFLHASTTFSNLLERTEKSFVLFQKSQSTFFTHFWAEDYPQCFKTLVNPPLVLFYKGQLPDQHKKCLGIVGSRKPNFYGYEILKDLFGRLNPSFCLQTVSGLAYGIDAYCHDLSLKKRYPTFAILGCGIDQIYPRQHLSLSEKILENQGGLCSEYAPGVPALPYHFPYRNRLIAALSDLLWVVQGHEKSGSLLTAVHALEQNKMIITTPGDVFSKLSMLPHRLLQEGAFPICSVSDLESFLRFQNF